MKRKLLIVVPVLLAFIALGVNDIYKQRQVNQNLDIQLNQREIRLNNLQQKMLELNKELDLHKGQTEQNQEKIKQLEDEKKRLEAELQAKLERKEAERLAHLKLQQATVRATGTAVASASGNCEQWLSQAGITHNLARELISRESGCRSNAVNPSSGACGIAQELLEPHQRAEQWAAVNAGYCPKSKCSMQDPVCQLRWMQNYVYGRYGSWERAIAFHNANNWY